MKRLALTPMALCLLWVASGCATAPDRNLAAARSYLQKLEEDRASAAKTDGPDLPESPVSRLPAMDEVSGGAVAAGAVVSERDIVIQPDSLVRVTVAEDSSLNGSYTVNEIGAINFGYVGPVILSNMTETRAARKIEDILKTRDFRKATVGVRLLRASYDKVSVVGAVGRAGPMQIGANDSISLNDLLLRAGGLRCAANVAVVRIVRQGLLTPLAPSLPGEEHRLVDADGRPTIPDVRLRNNDIAFVEARSERKTAGGPVGDLGGKTVLVLGEVRKQGFYYFSSAERCSMMHLMFKMGGTPPYAKTTAIRVVRRDKDGAEEEHVVNARRIMEEGNPDDDFPLEDGDRVIVPARRIAIF